MKHQRLFFIVLLIGSIYPVGIKAKTKSRSVIAQSNSNIVEMQLCYDFSVPGKTSKIKFIVALPKTIPGRQRIFIKYDPKPSKVFRENGQRYAEFVFNKPKKQFKVVITVRAKIFGYDLRTAQKKEKKRLSKGPNFKDFLKQEKNIEKDAPKIRQIAKTITGQTETGMVKSIYNYVIDNMEYGSFNKDDQGALKAAQQKKGDCSEYSDLFVALCRATNIPARVVSGFTTEFNKTPKHSWAEVYLKEYGWVPFDPTVGDRKNNTLRVKRFHTLKNIYIYRTHIRNDEMLNYNHSHRWRYWGDKIQVKNSIEFKQPASRTIQSHRHN